jgi:putative intracellular protease/amidase
MTPPMTPITPFSSSFLTTPPRHGAVLPQAMMAAGMAPLPAVPAGRAAGVRARGHFICDASLQALTSAPWFGELGRRTPVTLSIRRCGGPARADTVRGAFAFDVRFHEGRGPDAQEARPSGRPGRVAWCLQACSLPLCLHGPFPEPWRDGAPLAPWLWLMSDRALPRSWRMMQGFGTRTWRLVPAAGGAPVFACFHWLPAAGTHALAADEAEQLAVADPQFLQRDLRDALAAQAAPAWTLALQVFSERQAMLHGIDPHDPGPLLPHDWAPLRNVGRLVLASLADPATPAEADENAGEDAEADEHASAPGLEACTRAAPRWPDDDLQQARLFWRSQSGTEQQHLAQACRAACAALREPVLRAGLRQRLAQVDAALAGPAPPRAGPADAIVLPVLTTEPPPGLAAMPAAGAAAGATPAGATLAGVTSGSDRGPEPAALLSLLAHPGERSVRLRRVALLLAEGFEPRSLRSLQRALRLAGARPQCVGVQAGAFRAEGGGLMLAEASVESAPSVLWDAVVLPAGAAAQAALARSPAVARFVQEQYRHGKPILQLGGDQGLLARLGIPPVLPDGRSDPALLRRVGGEDELDQRRLVRAFLEALALPRRFDRGPACVPRPEPPGLPAGAH